MTRNQEALEIAVLAGQVLLENGAEISRVQGTIIKFLESFRIPEFNVYVISNGIFATVGESDDDPCSAVRYVSMGKVRLKRVEAVNELSREVALCGGDIDLTEVKERLLSCARIPDVRIPTQLLACAIGCFGFCYILGGSWGDSLAAFLTGLLLQSFNILVAKTKMNRFIVIILGGALITAACRLMSIMLPTLSLDSMIIGSIMPLVPGVVLTTSIRDFFNGDYISGSIHLIDALLVAACIAVGVGVTLNLTGFTGVLL